MRIAVPTEVKNNEFRVAMTPVGVHELTRRGHEVYVQAGAGAGSSFTDEEFAAQGARIVEGAEATWAAGEMVLKVKEPIESEYRFLTSDQVLFTYLHLAADRPQTEALLGAGTTAIAYETVQRDDGSLPLLSPMSEVAGCLAPQVGAAHLMKAAGGRGVLFGCVGGVQKAKVVVLGAGTAGQNAARIALGMGADVTVLDVDLRKLHRLIWDFDNRIQGLASTALIRTPTGNIGCEFSATAYAGCGVSSYMSDVPYGKDEAGPAWWIDLSAANAIPRIVSHSQPGSWEVGSHTVQT
ncbi:MAG: alanine dehydrogenase, partial [Propionibacterium acidifaciens]